MLFLEFNLAFVLAHLIPIGTLKQMYANIYLKSMLLFEFGNAFASQFIAVVNDSHYHNNASLISMIVHIAYVSTTFTGIDFMESTLLQTAFDYTGALINYAIYVLCIVTVLITDYFAKMQESSKDSMSFYKQIHAPIYEEDPVSFSKTVIIHYLFGIYMLTLVVRT